MKEPGKIYYCVLPDLEAEAYGEETPRAPWKGKLFQYDRPGGTVFEIVAVDRDGIPDQDSNATAIVTNPETQLFDTLEAAKVAYKAAVRAYIQKLLVEVQEWIAKL